MAIAPEAARRVRSPDYWANLAAAGLLLFYAIYIAWQAITGMTCSQLAFDYCEYVSSGMVANRHGYAAIYDRRMFAEAQRMVFPPRAGVESISVPPWPYPPVFILPFQLLAVLPPAPGFFIWTALNAALLIFYARSFLRRLDLPAAPARLLLLLFISLPVFMNLFLGQLNFLLIICVGEFMIATLHRRFFPAGMWLGGLLLKPQLLVLVGLVLLLQRAWRVIAGAAAASTLVALVSALLVGPAGLLAMVTSWISDIRGHANVWEQGMMNWRMVGVHLSNWISPWAGWTIAGAGILATLALVLVAWHRRVDAENSALPVTVAGVLAASLALAWHSHIHMAVVLLPPLLYLYQARLLPQRLFDCWVFIPSLVFVTMTVLPETLIALGVPAAAVQPVVYFLLGGAQLAANLAIFIWAFRVSISLQSPFSPKPPDF